MAIHRVFRSSVDITFVLTHITFQYP